MTNPFQLADVLGQYVQRLAYTPGQLARLSGVPQATIVNWLEGRVKKPRQWSGLLKLAAILHLEASEASELLQAAGHQDLDTLITRVKDEKEKSYLAPWLTTTRQRQDAPFQLIADLPYFVGRKQELQQLRHVLLQEQPVTFCALEGMGGVGKTSLAVHLAYLLEPHFPDGILWANVALSDTMSILNNFALAYGQDVSHATDVTSRSLAVRELLARKRALLILDNAQHSAQIRPLLPPNGRCAVLMTTRRRNLAVSRHAYRLVLGPFDQEKEDSLALFSRHLDASRIQKTKESLKQIADLLGHLPLAIDIVASRLAYEPNWQVADFLARLQQMKKRLNQLTYEDQNIRASFDFSYQALTADLQQLFVALSLFGGADFNVAAVAAMMNLTIETAHDRLRQIYGFSLIRRSQSNRYRLHPLLRDYAREQMPDGSQWHGRLAAYFVGFIEDHQTDYETLDKEYNNLLAALEMAVTYKMTTLLIQGVKALFHYLHIRGSYHLAEKLLAEAQQMAQMAGLSQELAHLLLRRGKVARSLSKFTLAETHLSQGLQSLQSQEQPHLTSAFLTELGTIKAIVGQYNEAEAYFQKSLQLARDMQDEHQMLVLLTALGISALRQGRYTQSHNFLQEGLALARQVNHRERMSTLLANLGVLTFEFERFEEAEAYYLEALEIQRQIDNRLGICITLGNLSRVAVRKADYETAVVYLEEGLPLARELGNPEAIHTLLRRFGIAEGKRGNYEQAHTYLQESLALTTQLGQQHQTSLLFQDLAELSCATQAYDAARSYYSQGLDIARQQNNKLFLCDFLIKWGDFCLEHRDVDTAHQAYGELIEIANQSDASAIQKFKSEAHHRLTQIAARQDNGYRAYH